MTTGTPSGRAPVRAWADMTPGEVFADIQKLFHATPPPASGNIRVSPKMAHILAMTPAERRAYFRQAAMEKRMVSWRRKL